MKANQLTKKIGLGFIILLLFAPIIQEKLELFTFKPLEGYFEQRVEPKFSLESWIDGSYQINKEKYIDQNFGLRNLLIRLNNQIDFWFLKKLHAEKVVLGKNGMLYESHYITSYLGEDYLGKSKVDELTKKLKKIQDYFEQHNKTFIIMLAPGKASFFPNQFPEALNKAKKRNNYEEFSAQLKTKNINTIDFNKWFLAKKDKTPFPLYTELGIHWTAYGASLAFDSLIKYISIKRNIDLKNYVVEKLELPDTLRPPDEDIFRALNLLFTMKHAKAVYPIYKTTIDTIQKKPSLLTIGDSYWWNIYNNGVFQTRFSKCRFWYYFQEAFPESLKKQTFVESLDFENCIAETDVIIFCFTESTLKTIGNGFIEKAYSTFCINKLTVEEKKLRIEKMMQYIRTDKNWMAGIMQRSEKDKLPVDSIIFYDARWQVENNSEN